MNATLISYGGHTMLRHTLGFPMFSLLFCFLATLSAQEIYVSPDGAQDGNGSVSSPFPTIEKARDKVREINDGTEDVVVYLRGNANGGYFFLDSTLVLDARDGGKNGHKVIYRNFPGERPVICGGRLITGWEKIDGSTPEKWKATLDHPKKIRYLFVDHVPGYRARGPMIRRGANWGDYEGLPHGFHTDNISLSNARDVELYKR